MDDLIALMREQVDKSRKLCEESRSNVRSYKPEFKPMATPQGTVPPCATT